MADEAKRGAQEALFAAIQTQAESNMKAALQASEKASLLRELAEAYRLTAGGSLPDGRSRRESSGQGSGSEGGGRARKSAEGEPRKRRSAR